VITEPVGHTFVVVDHRVEQRPRRGHGPELGDLGMLIEAFGCTCQRGAFDRLIAIA
jgi:hypothetical protein